MGKGSILSELSLLERKQSSKTESRGRTRLILRLVKIKLVQKSVCQWVWIVQILMLWPCAALSVTFSSAPPILSPSVSPIKVRNVWQVPLCVICNWKSLKVPAISFFSFFFFFYIKNAIKRSHSVCLCQQMSDNIRWTRTAWCETKQGDKELGDFHKTSQCLKTGRPTCSDKNASIAAYTLVSPASGRAIVCDWFRNPQTD